MGIAARPGARRPAFRLCSSAWRAHVDPAQDCCLEHGRRRGLAGPAGRNREARADDEWGITLERLVAWSRNFMPCNGFRTEIKLNLRASNRERGSCSGPTGEPLFFPANSSCGAALGLLTGSGRALHEMHEMKTSILWPVGLP